MAGKKKLNKEMPKKRKGKGRKCQEDGHGNNKGKVNKEQSELTASGESACKRAKRSGKTQKMNSEIEDHSKDWLMRELLQFWKNPVRM